MKVYYYGCVDATGHFMYKPEGITDSKFSRENPWKWSVDTGLCPDGPQVEGHARLHHKDGWTALAFWDRTVDRRFASNSVFLAEGTHQFDEMILIARKYFPDVWKRFDFPVTLIEDGMSKS